MGLRHRKQTLWSRGEAFLKRHSLHLLEKLFAREEQEPEALSLERIRSVLVIRQHDQLGDFMLATPVLRALRERLPNARIGLLVREYFEDVATLAPFVDEVLVFHERLTRWTLPKFRRLRRSLRGGWDLCIVLNTVSHSLTSDFLAYFSRAPFVLGSAAHVFPGCRRNFFYNLVAPVDKRDKHQTDRNLDIVRYVGIDTVERSEIIMVPGADRRAAKQRLLSQGVRFTAPVVGLHIGAGKPENRWHPCEFARLASSLRTSHDADILLFWGPAEEKSYKAFCAEIAFPVTKIPPSTLRSMAALFTQCDVLVCNDSAPMHIAAAAGVPVLAIFGRTDPAQWKPVGEKFDYVRSLNKSIDEIPTDVVLEKLLRVIEADKKTSRVVSSFEEPRS